MDEEKPFVYKNIVIDANNLFHKNHEKLKHMTHTTQDNITLNTGGIYGAMRSVWALEKKYLEHSNDARVYILFDNAKSKENLRKGVDPSYKLNRVSRPQSFYRALDYFRFLLMHGSSYYTVVYGTGYEADDIAPVVIDTLPPGDNVLAVSEDLDWARLIGRKGRTVNQLMKGQVFDRKLFNKTFDFEPTENKIVLYKVIRGDNSDNIPIGVPNLKTETLLRLIDDYDDIFDLLDSLEFIEYLTPKMKARFKENSPRLKLNHQLVSFIPLEYRDITDCVFAAKYTPQILAPTYKALGFNIEKFDSRVNDYLHSREVATAPDDDYFIGRKIKHV